MTRRAAPLALAVLLAAGGAAGHGAELHDGRDEGAEAATPPAEAALAAAPPALAPDFEPPAPGSYALPPILRVAPGRHRLLSSEGARVPLLEPGSGRVALVSFVFLHCAQPGGCPMATAVLHRVDREAAAHPELAGRLELVTVSFDPERDRPEALAELRARLAPVGRWRFLTAESPEAVAPVLADFGQQVARLPGEGADAAELRHVLKVFLVDPEGAVRNIYSAGFLDARLLLNDALTLLRE